MPPKTRQNKPQKTTVSRGSAAKQFLKAKSTWAIAMEKKAEENKVFGELRKCICGCYIRLDPIHRIRNRKMDVVQSNPDNWRHLDVEKAAKYGAHLIEFDEAD